MEITKILDNENAQRKDENIVTAIRLGYKPSTSFKSDFFNTYTASPSPLFELGYSFSVTISNKKIEDTVIIAITDPCLSFNLTYSKLFLNHFPEYPFISFSFPGICQDDKFKENARYPTAEEIAVSITSVISSFDISKIVFVAAKRATNIAQLVQYSIQTKLVASIFIASRIIAPSYQEAKEYVLAYSASSRFPTIGSLKECVIENMLPEAKISELLSSGGEIKCGANFTRLSLYNSFVEAIPLRNLALAIQTGGILLNLESINSPTLVFTEPRELEQCENNVSVNLAALPDSFYILSLVHEERNIANTIKSFLESLKMLQSRRRQ